MPATVMAEPAMFGHPGLTGQTRLVHRPEPGPGIALLQVRSALVRWTAGPSLADTRFRPSAAGQGQSAPLWALALSRQLVTAQFPLRPGPQTSLREAAVLVLLSDGPSGLQVLLTRRSTQLRQHPGEWVLPGGSSEAGDDGPVDTALREAREEAGVDQRQAEVLGALPALVLHDGGWVVVPVVACSGALASYRIDASEVAGWANVALRDLAEGWDGDREGPLGRSSAANGHMRA